MIRDDRLLLAELSRLNTDVVPLALRIMDQSATPEEHYAFADRLITMAHQLQARAAGPALVIDTDPLPADGGMAPDTTPALRSASHQPREWRPLSGRVLKVRAAGTGGAADHRFVKIRAGERP